MSLTAGSQVVLCDVPVRLDNYVGCSHGCKYCFAQFKTNIQKIKGSDVSKSLVDFINGKRSKETAAFDYDITIHWGGMSDPFQPIEKNIGSSYKLLKIFAETGYPVIISTKGKLISDEKYLDVLKNCNAVVQVSLLSEKYDKFEGVKFIDRFNMLNKVAKNVKRLIIRAQPYIPKLRDDILKLAKSYKDAGVYGIAIEGLKTKSKGQGMVKHFGDFVIPFGKIKSDFLMIKKEYNGYDMKVYGAENRLRSLGDSLTCCGVEGLAGFKVNKFNLNHLIFDKQNAEPEKIMNSKGVGTMCFKSLSQDSISEIALKTYSFKELMLIYFNGNKNVIG